MTITVAINCGKCSASVKGEMVFPEGWTFQSAALEGLRIDKPRCPDCKEEKMTFRREAKSGN